MPLDVNGALAAQNEAAQRAAEAKRRSIEAEEERRAEVGVALDNLALEAIAALREHKVPHNAPGGWALAGGPFGTLKEADGDYSLIRTVTNDVRLLPDGSIDELQSGQDMAGDGWTAHVSWDGEVQAAIVRLITEAENTK